MQKQRFLFFFVLCSVLPLAVAQAVLSFGWFSGGVNNKGQWLTQEFHLLPAASTKQHWRLVYLAEDAECPQQCQEANYLQQQVFQALGRKQEFIALYHLNLLAPELSLDVGRLRDYSGQLLLVDAKGVALLSYPVAQERVVNLQTGKDILSDLTKLLKYERGL